VIPSLEKSVDIIKRIAGEAGDVPGVYKMMDTLGNVMYVGKAKNIKKRLISYTRTSQMPNRLRMMISRIHKIEFIRTKNANEALILESNLIKELKPFFNVLLKDDKSYPYIVIDESTEFPRIHKLRAHKSKGENFYGPYPIVSALDKTLKVIQKSFLLRGCNDNYFNHRKRPCLQYFVKRCSAPCMNKISKEEYAKNIELTKKLLKGNDETARKILVQEMREASQNLDFERAATIRDRIASISEIQSKQYAEINNNSPIDIVVCVHGSEYSVLSVTFFRCGKNVGLETFVIKNSPEENIIEDFIIQFYKNVNVPDLIVTNEKLPNRNEIAKFVGAKIINATMSNEYKKIIERAVDNAKSKLNDSNEYQKELVQLSRLLDMEKINRIEAYDNSHIMGSNACGAMVVFENGKLCPDLYRKFNIDKKTANKGDDIAMMKFVLKKRLQSEKIPILPDLIIIDGGYTQLEAAREVVPPHIKIISIAKQNNRKIGDEKLILQDGREIYFGKKAMSSVSERRRASVHINVNTSSPPEVFSFLERKKEDQIAMHFVKDESEADLDKVWPSNRYNGVLQKGGYEEPYSEKNSSDCPFELQNFLIMLRNEVHKTAITFHRKKQVRSMHTSELDQIATIGPVKKKRLLEHFGSISSIKNASVEDIIAAQGINKKSAITIFEFFKKRHT
jgi:excinuclease ABC subunit C